VLFRIIFQVIFRVILQVIFPNKVKIAVQVQAEEGFFLIKF